MVVDIFTHFLPTRYFQQMIEVAPEFDRLRTLAPIHDLDARLRTMDVLHDYRQILSLPNPLDDPTFEPVFAAMAGYDLPIWLHPTRTAGVADYPTESRSRYEMWWTFGWPYETSVAMARLVVTGLFARHPTIKIITHHCGGMIPYFEGRVGRCLAMLHTGTVLAGRGPEADAPRLPPPPRPPDLGDFKKFYADTALFGALGGTRCGLEFFGVDHVTFGTDAPFGSIREIAESIRQVGLSDREVEQVYRGNAERLMRMALS